MSSLRRLSRPAIVGLAAALKSGRLQPPFSSTALGKHVPDDLVKPMRDELREMVADGMQPEHIARLLDLLAEERQDAQAIADRVSLVWSAMDPAGATTLDTGVWVARLFREAKRSILISSYAIDKGKKAADLFGDLATKMDKQPDLDVHLFLNVHRKNYKDETSNAIILREFADTFRDKIWPGKRVPEVYHDPRSLAVGGATRACLHAKCIVIDNERALITSANFTEAAQERNIEAGVLVNDVALARSLKGQFDKLVQRGDLKRVPGL